MQAKNGSIAPGLRDLWRDCPAGLGGQVSGLPGQGQPAELAAGLNEGEGCDPRGGRREAEDCRWLEGRWASIVQQEREPEIRRKFRLGEFVARRWDDYDRALRDRVSIFEGWLLDSPVLDEAEILDSLVKQVAEVAAGSPTGTGRPKIDLPSPAFPPYVQGYQLASKLRDHLGNRDKPVTDLAKTLEAIGIKVKGCESFGLAVHRDCRRDHRVRVNLFYVSVLAERELHEATGDRGSAALDGVCSVSDPGADPGDHLDRGAVWSRSRVGCRR